MTAPWCRLPTEIMDALIEAAEKRGGIWSEAEALCDLIRSQDLALRPVRPEPMRSYRESAVRWGWTESTKGGHTEGRARRLLADEDRWTDPSKADAWDLLRRQRKVSAESAQSQRSVGAPATVEPSDPTDSQRKVSAALAQSQRKVSDTRAFGSQPQLTTTTRSERDTAPVPDADLFPTTSRQEIPPTTPEAAPIIDAVAPAVPEAPATAGASGGSPRAKGKPPTAYEREQWERCVAAWAEIYPDKAQALEIDKGFGDGLLKAIRSVGGRAMLDRMRLLARHPAHKFRHYRDGAPTPLSQFTRKDNGHSATLDGQAVEMRAAGDVELLERPTPDGWREPGWTMPTAGAPATPTGPAQPAETVTPGEAAWEALAAVPEWLECQVWGGRAVNHPNHHGTPSTASRPTLDLAADRAEHTRRFAAYAAAGGARAWAAATSPLDRQRFGRRFVMAYDENAAQEVAA